MPKPALDYPFDLRAPGAIGDLIAFHHSWAGCARMEGEGDGGDGGAGDGAGDKGGAGGTGAGTGAGSGGAGDDDGFPKNTPWRDMTAAQQAAYWRHQSQKHEGRVKDLVGDRSAEDVKKDLAELSEIRQSQQTPAEKALAEAEERGRQAAASESNAKAARAILRASLETQGHAQDDVDELVDTLNLDRFIVDGDIDTTKLANFAKRFTPAGTANSGQQRTRDFGAGARRREGSKAPGEAGKAEAERRFGTKTTTGA